MNQETNIVRHSGCADCGDKSEPILTSIPVGMVSKAVCSKCLKRPEYQAAIKR